MPCSRKRRRPRSGGAALLDLELAVAGVALWLGLTCTALANPVNPEEATRLSDAVLRAHAAYRTLDEGETAQYIPALAEADPDRFGLVAMTVAGDVIAVGDTDLPFAIMSAAKPFTLALLLSQQGRESVLERIGVEPTGLPFNDLSGIEKDRNQPMNPLVNAGAITTVSLLEVDSPEQRWPLILDYFSAFAGEPLDLMGDVYKSISTSNYRNRALVNLLQVNGWLGADPTSTLDVYNKQSSVAVTARQLAAMGATLANGGVNPITGKRVLDAGLVDEVLSVMLLSGFYNESGRWAYNVGLPAKSGVGGGVVVVVPGQLALAAYSPRLSPAGNSIRGMRAIAWIARELRLGLFTSPQSASFFDNRHDKP
jgi:glutaminase